MPPDLSVADARRWTEGRNGPTYLVGTRDHLAGCVSISQLDQWYESARAQDRVGALVAESSVHVHPDHPIDVVLERWLESGGVLPVVSRADARRVEGVITRESILKR